MRGIDIVTQRLTFTRARTAAQRLALALCVALASTTSVGTVGAPVTLGGTPPCLNGWQQMAVEAAIANGGPTAAAALGTQPAWMVGRRQSLAMIGRWNPSTATWQRKAAPWSTDSGLTGVSPYSPTIAWAVGYQRLWDPAAAATRWNGTSWKAVAVPQPAGKAATLMDVVTINGKRMLTVGSRLFYGQTLPVALFRYETEWFNKSPTFAAGEEGALTTTTRSPDGKLWTAGWRSTQGAPQPWIAFWTGTAWSETPAADFGGGTAFVNDIVFRSATEGWVAGYREKATGGYAPLLQRWDGVTWQQASLPWGQDSAVVLNGVAVDAAGLLIVAGNEIGAHGPTAVVAVNDSGTWTANPASASAPPTYAQDAAGLGTGGFVIGPLRSTGSAIVTCEDASPTGNPTTNPGVDDPDSQAAFQEDFTPTPAGSGSSTAIPTTTLEGFEAVNMTAAAGLTLKSMTYGGVVADFNEDTWPDLWINRHGEAKPFYVLGGETGFTAAPATFQFTDRHLCDVADANGDGDLDMFCSVGRNMGTGMGAHEFLLNVRETGGTLAAAEYGLLDITGRGRAAAFVDIAIDPLPGLFVANEPTRVDGLPSFNRFYRNVDGTHFVPAPEMGLDDSSGGVCAIAENLDADPDDEILLCSSEAGDGLNIGARIYDFDGTAFVDRTLEWGMFPMATVDMAVADFNGDALPDIAQLSRERLRVSLGLPGGGFDNAYQLAAKKSYALAVGDINADSRPDIYVSRQALNNGFHLMLVNRGSGTAFTNVAIPQPGTGTADDVLALDYDKNGLTDFVTLNGLTTRGPVRLTAWFPVEE